MEETKLSEAQQEVLAGALAGAEPGDDDTADANVKVVDLSLVSNGTAIHDYKGGKLTVSLPYTLPEGGKAENVRVYYMNNRGLIERRKDAKFVDGKVQFTTTHLSTYVVSSKALTAENEFVDVPTNEWYVDTVEWAADNVITIGKDSTHFGPLDSCTRVQFVTFLWRAAGRPSVSKNTVNPFTDVSEDLGEEFYQAILWAYENGIAVGTTATTFSPNNNVLRGQAVTFMGRYAKNEDDLANKTGVEAFDDVENEGGVAAYYDSIGWAAANGISKGNNAAGTTFGPLDNCSRAEMVTFLYRLFMGISA